MKYHLRMKRMNQGVKEASAVTLLQGSGESDKRLTRAASPSDLASSGILRMTSENESDRLGLFSPEVMVAQPGKPLYRLLQDHIRGLIERGDLAPGDLIPPEWQLADRLQISQGTVKKAISNLVWEKLLFRHQGKGTYVSRTDFEETLFRFVSYGDADGKDVRIHKTTTDRAIRQAPDDVYTRLGLSQTSPVTYIERLGVVDDAPTLVEYSWWPSVLVPGLEDSELYIPDYFYALILDRFGIPVVRADETLTAEAADTHTAALLDIAPGTPVVVLKRMTYTSHDRIVEVRTTKGRADRFSYRAEIRSDF